MYRVEVDESRPRFFADFPWQAPVEYSCRAAMYSSVSYRETATFLNQLTKASSSIESSFLSSSRDQHFTGSYSPARVPSDSGVIHSGIHDLILPLDVRNGASDVPSPSSLPQRAIVRLQLQQRHPTVGPHRDICLVATRKEVDLVLLLFDATSQ